MAKDDEPLRVRVNDVWYEVVDSDWLRNIEAGALKAVSGGLLSVTRKETDHSGVYAQEHPEQGAGDIRAPPVPPTSDPASRAACEGLSPAAVASRMSSDSVLAPRRSIT
jgi:hypothetical protein